MNTLKKMAVIDWLIANIKTPLLDDSTDFGKICLVCLNYQMGAPQSPESLSRFERFGKCIHNFLPDEFREIKWNTHLDTKRLSKDYIEKIYEFNLWFDSIRVQIEMDLTAQYIREGKMRFLEILKRRFRQEWSEGKFVDMTAEQSVKVDGDSKLEVKIVDA